MFCPHPQPANAVLAFAATTASPRCLPEHRPKIRLPKMRLHFLQQEAGSSKTRDSREDRATQQTCSMGRRQGQGFLWGSSRGPWRARNLRGNHLTERARTRTSGVGLRGSETDAQQQQALEQRVCRPRWLGPAEASHRAPVGAGRALCGRQAHHQPVRSISVASDVRAVRMFVPFPFSSRALRSGHTPFLLLIQKRPQNIHGLVQSGTTNLISDSGKPNARRL
jgi:hypothetical protein